MKTKTTSRFPELFFALLAGMFLLLLPFQVWQELFFASQTAKVLFLGWGIVGFVVIGVVHYLFTGRPGKLTFTAIDLLFGLFLLYTAVHIVWIRPVQLHPLFVLQWLALGTLYIVFRRIEARHQFLLIIFVMVAGAAQAVYGNLQLYGFYPSYHNLFKLTGSFFNPGPYSGYLVSALPVAVGLYFIKSLNVRMFEGLNSDALNSFFVSVVSFVKRVFVVLNVPNNRNVSNNRNPSNGETRNPFFVSVVSFVKRVSVVLNVPNNRNVANNRNPSNISNGIALIAIISIILVLPAGRSRAAWFGALAGCFYVFLTLKPFKPFFKQSNLFQTYFKPFKSALIVSGILFLALALAGLYKFKQGSADGRVLIWKVTADAIKEQPLWGHGIEKFKAFYMEGQAEYFKDHPGLPETAVAGDNNYAFNEPLRITSETGLIGLALALLIIWSTFRNSKSGKRKQGPDSLILLSRAGLLAVFIFGLFSYPAEIVPIMVNVILYLAIISGSRQPILTMPIGTTLRNPFVRLISATALVATAILGSQQICRIEQSYTRWNEAFTTYSMGAYEEAAQEYEKTYTQLENNGDYLINYGKALSMAGKHQKAIEILERSKDFLNNTILYTALGDSYKATGQTAKAEAAYLHAWNMVPSRFYPKYLLAKLYDETGQHEKAVATAKELLSKEAKIESTAVKEIQEEMRKIIEKQENTQNMFNIKGKGRKHNLRVATASCPAPFSLRLTLGSSRTQSLVEAIPNVRIAVRLIFVTYYYVYVYRLPSEPSFVKSVPSYNFF